MAQVIREQMLAVGARHTLAPVLDVARDPRWGRLEETFGEDPWLIAQMGVAYVRGIQSERLATGVAATGKHFVGYGASEGGMNWAPAHLGPRELRDVYVFPFEAAIRLAGLASIMNAYHELDGCTSAAARRRAPSDLLRGELGFDGAVVADYFTVDTLHAYHRFATGKATPRAVRSRPARRRAAGDRLLRCAARRADGARGPRRARRPGRAAPAPPIKLELGLERPFVDAAAAPLVPDTAPQRALGARAGPEVDRAVAEQSTACFRCRGDAALSRGDRTLGVEHPRSRATTTIRRIWRSCSARRRARAGAGPRPGRQRIDLGAHFPRMVRPARRHPRGRVAGDRASRSSADATCSTRARTGSRRRSMARADVAIVRRRQVRAGRRLHERRVGRIGTLGLPGAQAGPGRGDHVHWGPTVVVLVDGRPPAIPWIAEHVGAVLHAWLPGWGGWPRVADVLFGDADPGGRLPVSMPRSVGQLPVFYGHKPSGGRSHWKGTYADGAVTPLFPFGHGLSYARFAYANLTLSRDVAGLDDVVEVGCEVTNVAGRAGEEVGTAHVEDVVGSVTRPVQELRGFVCVALAPGETARVVFALAVRALAFHDVSLRRVVEPGTIEVMVGASRCRPAPQGTLRDRRRHHRGLAAPPSSRPRSGSSACAEPARRSPWSAMSCRTSCAAAACGPAARRPCAGAAAGIARGAGA